MALDVTGFGLLVTVTADTSYPTGFVITQFADDADPFDIAAIKVAETAMTVNGDLVSWSKANPITVTINVVADSDDDINLTYLLEANRVGSGKTGARDTITMRGVYPDGKTITLIQGKITDGTPGSSVASAGRKKSKSYSFAFENKIESF